MVSCYTGSCIIRKIGNPVAANVPFSQFVSNVFAAARATNISSIFSVGDVDVVDVSSTCLSDVSYDLNSATLTVTFAESGAQYAYYGVPERVFQDIVHAGSVGQEYVFSLRNSVYGLNYSKL